MLRRLSMVLAFVVAAGCSSYRPVAPLDDDERAELVELRSSTARRPARLVGGPQTSPESVAAFADRLRAWGWEIDPAADDASSLRIEVSGPSRPLDDLSRMEGDILLFLLTLGLWPQHVDAVENWSIRISDAAGRETSLTSETSRPSYFGWIAGPLSALPSWDYLGGLNVRAPSETDAERDHRRDRAVLDLARALDAFARAFDATSGAR